MHLFIILFIVIYNHYKEHFFFIVSVANTKKMHIIVMMTKFLEEDDYMSLIGKKVSPFKVDAYHNNQFIEVTDKDLEGKWTAFVFYPADFRDPEERRVGKESRYRWAQH